MKISTIVDRVRSAAQTGCLRQYENFYYCRYPEGSVEAVV